MTSRSYVSDFDTTIIDLTRENLINDANQKWNFNDGNAAPHNGKKRTNHNDAKEDSNKKRKHEVTKYSGDGILAEAVIIGGKVYFAVSRANGNNEIRITLEDSIENEVEKFLPSQNPMSRTFSFKSSKEFDDCIDKAKSETLNSLYKKVKAIWKKYIDADDFHISICAADTIFTYYQDKIGLTHYLFFVGGNDTGKSNNLTVFEYVGYRCYKTMDLTAANIYTFLGNGQDGQGTLCEDEADNIDWNREKMRIYKGGYQAGQTVARTDLPHGERSQNKWNIFGFKAFAAEGLPDIVKAKGFHQRIIELQCKDGLPEHDIAEVINAEDEESKKLLNELNETHNLLLAHKLLHYHEIIPNINLNIRNREKQLFKPILKIFQNTKTLDELLPVVSHYINQRRERNSNSLEAFVYRTVDELIKQANSYELLSTMIWDTIKQWLPGEDIPNKPLSYDSTQFGIISQKKITGLLEQQFGAKKPNHKGSSNKLVFSQDRMQGLKRKYELADVKVSTESGDVGDVGDVSSSIGLDRHMKDSNKISETGHNNEENTANNDKNSQNSIGENDSRTPAHSYKHPQTSPSSPNYDVRGIEKIGSTMGLVSQTKIEEMNQSHIHKIGRSDQWRCDSCQIKADRRFMIIHNCSGINYNVE